MKRSMQDAAEITVYASPGRGRPVEPQRLKLGALAPNDLEIQVEACSLCHSDLHLLDDDWGISRYPLVIGHEIVGRIVRRGSAVVSHEIGTRVGIGWQCGACGSCVACTTGMANLCIGGKRRTCVDQAGGLAERVRADAAFAFPVPDSLDPSVAAPLFCAGVTVFAPLARHGVGPGSRVAILGLGGLGHLAVQFARALGADVTVFDPAEGKHTEALQFGARQLLGVGPNDLRAACERGERFDFVLSTTHADLDWNAWLELVAFGGTLCITGIPPKPMSFASDHLIDGQKNVTGSAIGSPDAMRAMLAFAARHRIRPLTETLPFARANEALERLRAGKARYRIVLTP